jgi:hypothetical protein
MTNLEKYLNNATRGIWSKNKLEIREELHNDLLERTRKHQLAGLSQEAATTRAIQELGDARVLNRGMTGVYMMPTFFKSAVAAVMISLALVLNMQPSIAQVTSTTRIPIPQCLESKSPSFDAILQNKTVQVSCDNGSLSVSLSSLKKVLQPLNVKVLEYPDVAYKYIGLTFPEGSTALLNIYYARVIEFPDSSIKPDLDYINASALLTAISLTPLNVRISGWENPRISVGKTTFTLGTTDNQVLASSLYFDLIRASLDDLFPAQMTSEPFLHASPSSPMIFNEKVKYLYVHKIRYNAEPGTVLVVVSRETDYGVFQAPKGEKQSKFMRRVFLTPVKQDGTFEYSSRSKTLHFENQINKLKPLVDNGMSDVIVLRLLGDFSFNSKEQFQTIKPGALTLESSQKR